MTALAPRFWFTPTWSGDFRLIKTGEFSCRLTVEKPSAAELVVLGTLFTAATANGWIPGDPPKLGKRRVEVDLAVPIWKAGPIVSGSVHGDSKTWTAVRHEDNRIVVVSEESAVLDATEVAEAEIEDGLDAVDLVPAEGNPDDPQLAAACTRCGSMIGAMCVTLGSNPRPRAPHKARKVATGQLKAPPALVTAAATVRPPCKGCPAPEAAPSRASEVLRVFSTAQQYDQFTREGCMRVIGNRSGQAYFVFHRNEAARRGLTHCLLLARTGEAICVWDDRVPPEEEALAIKLAIEHREGWLMSMGRGPGRLADFNDRYLESWGGRGVRAVVGTGDFEL